MNITLLSLAGGAALRQIVQMRPTTRKIVYAISFETLGIVVATLGLLAMSDAGPAKSFGLAVLAATAAMTWSFIFNSLFEAWEARQDVKGRSLRRRIVHAILFEAGLVVILLPLTAWWLGVGLWLAFVYEAGLIALFLVYTYVFTWGFDAIFGLPQAAR